RRRDDVGEVDLRAMTGESGLHEPRSLRAMCHGEVRGSPRSAPTPLVADRNGGSIPQRGAGSPALAGAHLGFRGDPRGTTIAEITGMYRFGDGTPFPLQDNFIDTLLAAIDACVGTFGAAAEIDERREKTRVARKDAEEELKR